MNGRVKAEKFARVLLIVGFRVKVNVWGYVNVSKSL